jgi:tRNA nucleotidyltransferase/poly(A) polymerase
VFAYAPDEPRRPVTYTSPHERPELRAPADVARITRVLQDAGFDTWTVGGAVRDALAGRAPGDWDLTTAARPRDVQRLFRRTVPVGVAHGTVGVLGKDGRMYEVTTFRRDVETDGRHAVVRFSDTVEQDLQRRDFTINAVAWHPLTREVRDPHGGMRDLRDGVLRTVGDPRERFREDRLRVLRALRFAARFGLRVDDATWAAARDSAPELPHLSAERVREELLKVLRETEHPSAALRLYEGCGALATLYPELQACAGVPDGEADVWTHLLHAATRLPRHHATLRLPALLHDVGKSRTTDPAEHAAVGAATVFGLMSRLKFSNAETDRLVHLVAQHSGLPSPDAPEAELRRWIRRVGPAFVRDVVRLRVADVTARGAGEGDPRLRDASALRRRVGRMLASAPALTIGDLAIGGAGAAPARRARGPLMGEILRDLLEAVTDDPSLNTREALTEIVRRRLDTPPDAE